MPNLYDSLEQVDNRQRSIADSLGRDIQVANADASNSVENLASEEATPAAKVAAPAPDESRMSTDTRSAPPPLVRASNTGNTMTSVGTAETLKEQGTGATMTAPYSPSSGPRDSHESASALHNGAAPAPAESIRSASTTTTTATADGAAKPGPLYKGSAAIVRSPSDRLANHALVVDTSLDRNFGF